MPSKKVAFVLSTPRSGSTLLDLILGSHKACFSLGEIIKLSESPARQVACQPVCGVCESECTFWDKELVKNIAEQAPFSRRNKLRRENLMRPFDPHFYFPIFDRSGASVLVDSSKRVDWAVRRLKMPFEWNRIEPFFILLERDGRAVLNSWLRKFPNQDAANLSIRWKRWILDIERFYSSCPPNRKTRLAYEDLACDPAHVARYLCEALGLDFDESMLSYWTKEHHLIGGNKATRSLIQRQRDEFGKESNKLGDRRYLQSTGREDYYRDLGLAIKLDERWRKELSAEAQQIFEKNAGLINKPYERS